MDIHYINRITSTYFTNEESNVCTKSNGLISILDKHFKGKVNSARVKLIALFITSLCKVQTVTFSKLANSFDNSANSSSSLRRIQRFIATFLLIAILLQN